MTGTECARTTKLSLKTPSKTAISVDNICSIVAFVLVLILLVGSPWLFGSWEMWWFWPFAIVIFLAAGCLGIRLLAQASFTRPEDADLTDQRISRIAIIGITSFMPFLWYACVRLFNAPVFMDAERSFMLFFTPFLLVLVVTFALSDRHRQLILLVMLVNLLAIGLYGIINHAVDGSKHVLWVDAYPSYLIENRAMGCYFCPDHFAGAMELAFCIALAVVMDRRCGSGMKALSSIVLFVSLAAVALSKSRGGGLTILVVLLAAVALGFRQWPERARRTLQFTALAFVFLAVVGFVFLASSYVARFEQHFAWSSSEGQPLKNRLYLAKEMLRDSSRGLMFAGAIRAWHTQPVWGIGPGMHQNLWPHFAASPDGDREEGIWPTRPCNDFHSYEVHSDWLQLLEEYGIVGMVLFFAAFITIVTLLFKYYRMKATDMPDDGLFTPDCGFAMVLAAFLAIAAMAFHSLGDFNLQIPANTWMLAAIIGMPLGRLVRHK